MAESNVTGKGDQEHALSFTVVVDAYGPFDKVEPSVAKALAQALYLVFGEGRWSMYESATGMEWLYNPHAVEDEPSVRKEPR